MDVEYEERQTFSPWVYILFVGGLGAGVPGVTVAVATSAKGELPELVWPLAVLVIVSVVVLNMLFMITRVSRETFYVRHGLLFPMLWKRIPLRDVRACRVVEYRPLRDAGAWGVRFGRFEGASCRHYNARGNRGVFLETSKRRYIIGSQNPERLHDALVRALAVLKG